MDVLDRPRRKSRVFNEIQITLNVCFPKTHFEIKTYNTQNYKVVEISYTDGASLTRVKNAVKSFNRPANSDIHSFGVRIDINRNMSHPTRNLILNELKSIFNLKVIPSTEDWVQPINSTAGDYINRIFKMRDFDY